MGANSFSKEETVLFAEQVKALEDQLSAAGIIPTKRLDQTQAARNGDTFWIPKPYIMPSFDGLDLTSNFSGKTQLSVPARISNQKGVPFEMDGAELRDALQEKRLFEGALRKLASDVNLSVIDALHNNATVIVKRSGAATGFDDLAAVAAKMDGLGVDAMGRVALINSGDYLGMASDLAKASRTLMGDISTAALREAYVGDLANIATFRAQYTKAQAAAAATGITMSTLVGAANFWVPVATVQNVDGQDNVDARRQTITVSSTTGIAVGDSFTVANVFAVHPITKQSTGELKSFRVMSVPSSTTLVISPPMITAQGASAGEVQYQNCVVSSAASNAPLVFLNTVAKMANYVFQKDAVQLLPGRLAFPGDAGWQRMSATLSNGIEVSMLKMGNLKAGKVEYRADARWGVAVLDPEQVCELLFSQT